MSPSQDDVTQMVGALMTLMGGLERARKNGLANTLALLQVIATPQDVRPSEIAAELGIHASSVTRLVQALEADGQVVLRADPHDRRSCLVALTDAGHAEVLRLTEVGLARFSAFVADWDAEEVRTLSRLLRKLEHSKATLNAAETRRGGGRHWQKAE